MKFLRVFLLAFPFIFTAQTLDAAYKKLYARLEKGENLHASDFQKIIDQYPKDLQNFPDESAELYYYKAGYLYSDGKTDEAIQSFNGAFNYALRAKDTLFKYYVILEFARITYNTKAYDKSEDYYKYALPGMAVVYGASDKRYTKIYYEYIRLLVNLGRLNEAKPLLDALQYYYETLKMYDDPTYLAVIGNQGYVLETNGYYKEALVKYKYLIDEDRLLKEGDTLEHVVILSNMGEVYREMGSYDEALSYLQSAKRFIQKYKIVQMEQSGFIENYLGLLYKALNDYKNAEKSFDNALRIYKSAEMENTEAYCTALSNKGDLMRLLGRKDDGLKLLRTSIQTREKYFGKNSESYANALTNYGLIAYEYNEIKIAQEYFEEALGIYEKVVSKTHQSYANCLNNLSSCYVQNGNYKKAEEYKFEAIKIIETTLGKEHFKYISYVMGTADILYYTKNYAKAIQLLSEAKILAKKKFGINHDLYIRSLINLGCVNYLAGKYEDGVLNLEEAIDLKLKNLSEFFYTMNKEDQTVYLEEVQGEMIQYANCLFGYSYKSPKANLGPRYEKYFDFHLMIKSLLNKNTTEFQRQLALSTNDYVMANYKKWMALKNSLNELYRSDFTMAEQDSLHSMINTLETKLRLAINYKQPEKSNFKSLKSVLKPGEAIIDISWFYHSFTDTTGATQYAALITKNNSMYPECILLSSDKLDEQKTVQDYNDRMDKEIVDSVSHDLFFARMKPALKDISKLYISTKGDYSRINFQTLYDVQNKNYLIDQMDIVYMPDLSALKNQEINSNNTKEAQLFGNPDFNYDFRKKIPVKPKVKEQPLLAKRFGLTAISDLPGTETELNEIEKLMNLNGWKFGSYTREKANEENLRKVNSPKILHIATHGYFLKEVETDDDKFLGYNSTAFKQLADVRSGLILAGASVNTSDTTVKVSADKDGLLTSREASLLNLSNTDVVILSACQTGLGVETLNMGVIGLQQAFSNAGAKNLILSLWPVDDNATQLLMVKFYEYWLKDATNQNISPAFKKAQLDVKQKFPHPYYWGAFVLLKN